MRTALDRRDRGGPCFQKREISVTKLSRRDGFVLKVDGEVVDESVHGRGFWQTDYDQVSRTSSRTYNLPRDGKGRALVEFGLE